MHIVAALVASSSLQLAPVDVTWTFDENGVQVVSSTNDSPPSTLTGARAFADEQVGGGFIFDGASTQLVVAEHARDVEAFIPTKEMTVQGWFSIDMPQRWGGLMGCVTDDGDVEYGWILGYDETHFTAGLSSVGADDGNGKMTYFAADQTPYEIGKWHHVAMTYDGEHCRIYVDGQLSGETAEQSGDVLYDDAAPLVIGAYLDSNEHFLHDGRMASMRLTDRAMSPQEIQRQYLAHADRSNIAPWTDTVLGMLVSPFLNWPTTNAMTISFETNVPTRSVVNVWHESGRSRFEIKSDTLERLHHARFTALDANEKYFYQVSARDTQDAVIESDVYSFRTAATRDRPFTFVAIGDTQSQAPVAKRVSDLAYMHRPNLVVHAGDLVDSGSVKSDWTNHFFPVMHPLIARVPLMPVLGNHEQDARNYYEYMDLPEPEYAYSFTFGDAEFFMIDGNRELGDDSAQLNWLESALKASTTTWKFAVLHQPPYTSDSDDYGKTVETTSTRGDTNVQHIIALLEKYNVDLCFSGHVHDYERTFPIRDGKVVSYEDGGVIYVTTAGGGGHLENFDPTNTWFGHKKARYHHLVYVAVNGNHLEFQAIDEHGRLFDVFELRKDEGRRSRNDVSTTK